MNETASRGDADASAVAGEGTPAAESVSAPPAPLRENVRPYFKMVLVAALVAVMLVLVCTGGFKSLVGRAGELAERVQGLGWAAPAVFVAAAALLVAIGVPRLLLCPVAGLAFGFWWGLLWSQAATVIGSYATFLFVRWGAKGFVLRKWPRMGRYSTGVAEGGVLAVILSRQVPVSSFWISSLLALTHVRQVDFLVGTTAGILPEAIPATLVGAGAGEGSTIKSISYILAGVLWFVMIGLILKRSPQWLRKPSTAQPGVPGDGVGAIAAEIMEVTDAAEEG